MNGFQESIICAQTLADPKRPKFWCLEVLRNFVQSTTRVIMNLHAFKVATNAWNNYESFISYSKVAPKSSYFQFGFSNLHKHFKFDVCLYFRWQHHSPRPPTPEIFLGSWQTNILSSTLSSFADPEELGTYPRSAYFLVFTIQSFL